MSKGNVLLQKAELGKNKTGFHELPTEEHVYGKAPIKDQYGAREGTSFLIQWSPGGSSTMSPQLRNLPKILWR
jgi:hypothetical protein